MSKFEEWWSSQHNKGSAAKVFASIVWEARDSEIDTLTAENAKLNKKFKRCDEERAMANRQVEKYKDMWKGQCNRSSLLEAERDKYREALERIAEFTDDSKAIKVNTKESINGGDCLRDGDTKTTRKE